MALLPDQFTAWTAVFGSADGELKLREMEGLSVIPELLSAGPLLDPQRDGRTAKERPGLSHAAGGASTTPGGAVRLAPPVCAPWRLGWGHKDGGRCPDPPHSQLLGCSPAY